MSFTDVTFALTVIAGIVILARGQKSGWAHPWLVTALTGICLAVAIVLLVAAL